MFNLHSVLNVIVLVASNTFVMTSVCSSILGVLRGVPARDAVGRRQHVPRRDQRAAAVTPALASGNRLPSFLRGEKIRQFVGKLMI